MRSCERSIAGHLTRDVQLRPTPYPYRSMLAICSDLDDTPDRHIYWEIMRFLNTTEKTSMGQGVGLEVGNSIHFRAMPGIFSYRSTDDAGRRMVQTLIRSGHIDCLHSFGELVNTRDEVERAISELKQHGCYLEVWVDHGGAVTNFGPDIMQGHGDEIGHPAYHADLTIGYGIKYVCLGRATSITAQDVRPSLCGIFRWDHPVASGQTVLVEATKRVLARAGSRKYAMHGPNETLRPIDLRDGSRVYEFMRCNPYWGGVSACAQGRHIDKVLNHDVLSHLVERGGTCVLYTHLGRGSSPSSPFGTNVVGAFQHLASEYHSGRILVTTTRRLLGYRRAIREIGYDIERIGTRLCIDLRTGGAWNWVGSLQPSDLSGLTFYLPDPENSVLSIDGKPVGNLQPNPPDHTGRASVSLPWHPLEFPRI